MGSVQVDQMVPSYVCKKAVTCVTLVTLEAGL